MTRRILGFLIPVAFSLSTFAVDIGDRAPSLSGIKTWMGGEAFDPSKPDKKTISVIEFWATWCPPCRTTMPHLSELQKRFADQGVVIIGVTDEAEETVRPFVDPMKLTYRIAIDSERSVSESYMKNEEGIPHAFVVDATGTVVWHGHPMAGLDEVLLRLVEGRFDAEKAKKTQDRQTVLTTALQQGDYPAVLKIVDEMILNDERNLELYQMKAGVLMQLEDAAGLSALFEQMVDVFKDSSGDLNDIAWMIVAPSPLPLPQRNIRLAYKAARRAKELTDHKDPVILDTLARVYHTAGLPEKAIETQARSVELTEDPVQKKALSEMLGYYQSLLKVREEIQAAEAEPAK